jgi:hypothetical protein
MKDKRIKLNRAMKNPALRTLVKHLFGWFFKRITTDKEVRFVVGGGQVTMEIVDRFPALPEERESLVAYDYEADMVAAEEPGGAINPS